MKHSKLFKIKMNLGEGFTELFTFTPIKDLCDLLAAGASLANVSITCA